jgi:hypothetical protein
VIATIKLMRPSESLYYYACKFSSGQWLLVTAA